jgi:hypothetical protein
MAFATIPRHLASPGSKIGAASGMGSSTENSFAAVLGSRLASLRGLLLKALAFSRSRVFSETSFRLRMPSTCRRRVASASVGSRCNRSVLEPDKHP